jgi:hypothetical protein
LSGAARRPEWRELALGTQNVREHSSAEKTKLAAFCDDLLRTADGASNAGASSACEPSLFAVVGGHLPPVVEVKGQEKGNVVLCNTSSRLPLKPSRQSLRGLIQPIIETGKPCLARARPSRHLSERRQVDAVEASQPVSFGELPCRSA